LSIPARGWSLDVDNFHTSARNFLDHDVIGDSGIFIPLTDLGAIISGTEVTLALAAALSRYAMARRILQSDWARHWANHWRVT
jgi:hypothetical protein